MITKKVYGNEVIKLVKRIDKIYDFKNDFMFKPVSYTHLDVYKRQILFLLFRPDPYKNQQIDLHRSVQEY